MKIIFQLGLLLLLFIWPLLGWSQATDNREQLYARSNEAFKNRDWDSAFKGFKSLAESGHSKAQFKLGYLYRNGRGTEKDFPASVFWYRKAATAGHVRAQNYLAISLELGRGVEKNIREAALWYRRAAEQNNLNAMHWMAKAHLDGRGLKQDYESSYVWFSLARDLDMDCGRMRSGQEQALKKLSPQQIKSAQNRILEWRRNDRKGSP